MKDKCVPKDLYTSDDIIYSMLEQYECKRCGKKWIPRIDNPVMCPKCRSPYWNRDRKTVEVIE